MDLAAQKKNRKERPLVSGSSKNGTADSSKSEPENSVPLLFLGILCDDVLRAPSLREASGFILYILEHNMEDQSESHVIRLSWWNYMDASQERFALACADMSSYAGLLDWVTGHPSFVLLPKDVLKEALKNKKLSPPSRWKVVLPAAFQSKHSPKTALKALMRENGLKGDFALLEPVEEMTPEDPHDPRSEWVLYLSLSLRAELSLGTFSKWEKDGRLKTMLPLAGLPTHWWKSGLKNT